MNFFIKKKLKNIIENNVPLIKNIIEDQVLPKIKGSISRKENQILAFQILYKTLDKVPILSVLTTFVKEEDFIDFMMPYAESYFSSSLENNEKVN